MAADKPEEEEEEEYEWGEDDEEPAAIEARRRAPAEPAAAPRSRPEAAPAAAGARARAEAGRRAGEEGRGGARGRGREGAGARPPRAARRPPRRPRRRRAARAGRAGGAAGRRRRAQAVAPQDGAARDARGARHGDARVVVGRRLGRADARLRRDRGGAAQALKKAGVADAVAAQLLDPYNKVGLLAAARRVGRHPLAAPQVPAGGRRAAPLYIYGGENRDGDLYDEIYSVALPTRSSAASTSRSSSTSWRRRQEERFALGKLVAISATEKGPLDLVQTARPRRARRWAPTSRRR